MTRAEPPPASVARCPRVPTSPTGTPALEAVLTPAAAPGAGVTTCPTCGKPVQAGFAFCGSCGTRIGKAPSGAVAALGVQKTMYGAGAAPTPSPVAAPRGRLVLIRPDGTEGGTHPLHDGETLIGRGQGTLFEADAYLSPRHADFLATANGLTVRDLRSFPAYAAALLAITYSVITRAILVPAAFRVRATGTDGATLQQIFMNVERWWGVNDALHVLTFGLSLWAFAEILLRPKKT